MGTQRTSVSFTGGTAAIVGAIGSGAVSALLFAYTQTPAKTLLASVLSIFVSYLTAIPLFLTGLGAGNLAVLIAVAFGVFGLFLKMPSNIAVIYAFLFGIPTMILTMLALRSRVGSDMKTYWYPEGNLLTAATLYPCAIFLVFAGLGADHPGGLLDITQQAFYQIGDEASKQLKADEALLIHNALTTAAKVAPAAVSWAWVCIAVISMGVAQAILQKKNWNLRAPFALADLQAPQWLISTVVLTGLMGILAPAPYNYVGENIAIILGLPFFCVGLAVVHAGAATLKTPKLALIIFYLVLSAFVWLAPVVAMLGVVDQWADFRHRWRQPKPSL